MNTIDRRQMLRATGTLALTAALATQAPAMSAAHAHGSGGQPGADPGEARPLDGRPFPAYDYSRANKLPKEMTGYWTKSFDIDGQPRTAKVYISPETPIRSYFTVIAVPDGITTSAFLRTSSWLDIARRRQEGLFVLEPGEGGWGAPANEAAYVEAAMAFYQSNRYFSIFGEHYLVGYGSGAPALEAWAVAHPLRVISQAYIDSAGLSTAYLSSYAAQEFGGETEGTYTDVVFPDGFDLIRYDQTVLPTWYIHPDQRSIGPSLAYWKRANDTVSTGARHGTLGTVYKQRRGSGRWMTSYAGPISQVAVHNRQSRPASTVSTSQIVDFLTTYTRYENFFAYGNQLFERADYAKLGVQVRTMMVEGFLREYLVYVPRSARKLWRTKAPVVFVWPGNSQTDKVFFDAAQWWKVAEREGCILVTICEQYSNTSVSVSHRDSVAFFRQLRDIMVSQYPVDPTRFYSTGQSAGSGVTQNLAIAFPEYFAAVASTSFTAAPSASGTVTLDGIEYPASSQTIPNYQIYGYGDLSFLAGGLWDDTENSLDSWARHHLRLNGLQLSDVDTLAGQRSGWHDRFQTWTWHARDTHVPVLKLTKNLYRSHNTIPEESPLMWDFLKHYSRKVDTHGNVTRYYSRSGFRPPEDKKLIGAWGCRSADHGPAAVDGDCLAGDEG
ncbi:PHB depolymerase family esterase [Phytohabitans sp. ZYX-F-186]|uniref:PHB depolymerase family esterase n=1 Tax=Phytohabitans maris TaxID=3071409 RepID=A0ABU0ZCL4_9ACTN|nr:PHB depolymerase family esterase [Phytohabitans sp. ZYX-F-186]MDQ7904804.1 PHB depolymerase family esterase [Phytohabitans sp. ZYX-F-186]